MRRLDNIDLRLLRVFMTLVDAGGFAGAQIALNLSQSTLSTHLADLEKRLGGQLCIRGRKAFRLTDLGQATYEAATRLFIDVENFGHRVAAANGRLTGRLRLGIVDGVITSRELGLQHTLNRLMQPDIDVVIDLTQATPLELEKAVAEGRRDAVIGPFSQQAPGIVYRSLYRELNELYCGKGHPLFDRPDRLIDQSDIERANLSVRAYRQLDDLYRIGHSKVSASVHQMEAQAMLILSGHYIGFLPKHMAEIWSNAGQMRAIKPGRFGFHSQHFLAFRQSEADRPIIRALLAALVS
ncbi:LysR family transcriptional regulator [Rhizobium sp. BK376]|uniref:LysR family transcriptional regulator n=1 Tax=Rhizobium sp. BK376 TaxID=2512149 RepID=UPI0010509CE7|nr:LysR family transcriptional regulator [Rhizobium sp. BK376]TCR72730.1 DNA-binding transcriptional LysR family regulator [Rhizobium sp. BK376]